ncbi:Six-hairpin glycosidase [Punctularia strigosozonata HHB-11173 SS5]|uniref:Six-hairpin glycosidase n=1 Tax=Punctularia strigosozonata (strain HHB-11173) TaxID=741275 RepID=UPI0004417F1F|nr:Six-hairpin glycosidase [Punctularia strigosozonata HHB-11173 SS5]EIN13193.1 Six-hairpin glycosidase [Punctularia strigosozonata HHB-11173 SS5]
MNPASRLLAASLAMTAVAVPYEQYILAPSNRTLHPVSVYGVNGTVFNAESVIGGEQLGNATFDGPSSVTFDYGKNIAGVVTLVIRNVSDEDQFVGITFSESSLWISSAGSDATGGIAIDDTLWIQAQTPGVYTVPRQNERGGFRYLSLIHNTTGTLDLARVTTQFTAMPHYAEDQLRNYSGYFHSDGKHAYIHDLWLSTYIILVDELLNRIWYAGAYTNQLCTIDPHYGDAVIHPANVDSAGTLQWWLNITISNGTSVLVDGAKRDRLVWAGDMSIAVPSIVTSTNDLVSIQNSLNSLFAVQDKTSGQLPYAGQPFPLMLSQTYHMYTLIGVANYYFYSNDIEYIVNMWDDVKLAVDFALSFVDDSGLMDVTSPNDWLRYGMGGHNIEANAILYHTLNQLSSVAAILNESSLVASWAQTASTLKSSANTLLWDHSAGMYRDNETTTLHPQDGNAWAVVANLTLSATQSRSISSNLAARWTAYGAPAPEAADAISPFISGFELQAHVLAGNVSAALDLMRLQWGFMLDDPRMTNSTFIEGYSTTGALHYAPYSLDARISHAHGWATGPTSTLTFLIAGIQLTSAGGKTWLIKPGLGDLARAEAGFVTSLGSFSVNNTRDADTGAFSVAFETPEETSGALSVEYPDCDGTLTLSRSGQERLVLNVKKDDAPEGRIELDGLDGGSWQAVFTCSS